MLILQVPIDDGCHTFDIYIITLLTQWILCKRFSIDWLPFLFFFKKKEKKSYYKINIL